VNLDSFIAANSFLDEALRLLYDADRTVPIDDSPEEEQQIFLKISSYENPS
jgi:hypothetical protein